MSEPVRTIRVWSVNGFTQLPEYVNAACIGDETLYFSDTEEGELIQLTDGTDSAYLRCLPWRRDG